MTLNRDEERDPKRLRDALRLVLKRYGAQIRRRPAIAIPAVVLPAIGDILTPIAYTQAFMLGPCTIGTGTR